MKQFYPNYRSGILFSGRLFVLLAVLCSFTVSGQITYSGPYSASSASPTPLALGVGTNTISHTVTTPPSYQAWFDLTLPAGMEITGVTLQVNDPANISSGTICFNPFSTCNPSDTWSSGGQAATPITSWSSPGTLPITSSPGVIQVISNIASNTTWTLVFTVAATAPSCDIAITGIATTPPSCPAGSDGSITVTTTCPSCVGAVAYSLDNTTWQASNTFTRPAGPYTVYVRDSGNTTCTDSDTATIAAGTDTTPPAINCPGNIVVSNDAETCGAVVTYTTPVGTDNCSGAVTTQTVGLPSGSVFPVGTTTNTFLVTDGAGNTATCSFTVTVNDTEAPQVVCQNITVQLDADGLATILPEDVVVMETNYTVDQSGVFNPINISGTATNVSLGDDQVSGVLPLGFDFDFYGNTYNNFYISSNGFITFNTDFNSGCCSGQLIPSAGSPNNLIAMGWGDINPGNGGQPGMNVVRYATVGAAPNRILVVEFFNVDQWPSGSNVTFQAHLFESSNHIEIHTTTFPSAGNFYTQGVENADGTVGVAVPGRNSQNYSLSNDFVAFIPELTTSDNCGIASITIDMDTFDCSHLGDNNVLVTVTDNNGNVSTCTAIVTVEDTIAPEISCVANQIVDTDAGVCTYTHIGSGWDAVATDNAGAPLESYADINNWSATASRGTTNITYETVNGEEYLRLGYNGNGTPRNGTYVYTITAENTETIEFDWNLGGCHSWFIANASFRLWVNNTGNIVQDLYTGAGWCGFAASGSSSFAVTAGTQWGIIVTGSHGDSANLLYGQFDIQINPCILTTSYELTGATTGTGTTLDGVTFNLGETTVTWTTTDPAGNTDQCSFTVTVEDNEAPAIICVANQTIDTDAGVCTYTHSGIAWDATATDNCSVDTITYELTGATTGTGTTLDGVVFNLGVTSVTWTAIDGSTNTNVCSYTVTVEDNEAPAITCVANQTIDTDAGVCTYTHIGSAWDATATDNCSVDTITYELTGATTGTGTTLDGVVFNLGVTTVTWTATDGSTNTDVCSYTVTVEDNEAPIAMCAAPFTIQLDANGQAFITVANIDMGSTDNCGIDTITISQTDFDCSHVGDNTITLTVTDANGNTSTCTTVVTVEDNVAPEAICAAPFTIFLDFFGNASITVADIDNGSNDACGIASMTIDPSEFTCADIGDNVVTLTVTDNNGNVSTCTTIVTVEDNLPPQIVCPNDIVIDTEPGSCEATVFFGSASAYDNCSGFIPTTQTAGPPSGSTFPIGVTTITFMATDASGNTSSCSFTITVVDNQAPVAVCQNITIQLDADGLASITAEDIDGGSTDNCDSPLTFTASQTSFDCSHLGENTITLTVTDAEGNSSTCTAIVTVEDSIAPVALCVAPFTIELDADGQATITAADIDAGSTDNCSIASMTLSQSTFTCADLGENEIILTITDVAGNSTTCTTTVTVEDNISPIVSCIDFTLELGADGTAFLTPEDIGGTSTDNCAITITAIDIEEFDCSDIGTPVLVTYFASDASGNIASCTAMVTVIDNLGPVIDCPADQTVDTDPNSITYTVPDYFGEGIATATDNCTIPVTNLSQTPAPGTLLLDGTYTVNLTATDEYGNESTCSFELTVDTILGAEDTIDFSSLTMYPNPAVNEVTIGNPQFIAIDKISVYDVQGRLVISKNTNGDTGNQSLNVSDLSSAVYMVVIESEGRQTVKRLIRK